ncbi:MAG: KAP family NTPase [Dehalobacter sp.]|nr:KAP family NTPase [Dehalobacter sp.]
MPRYFDLTLSLLISCFLTVSLIFLTQGNSPHILSMVSYVFFYLLVFLITLAAIRIHQFFSKNKFSKNNLQEYKENCADSPIFNPADDIFERKYFAKKIADELLREEPTSNIVIAIEDDWGSGKTSLMNIIRFYLLEGSTESIVINFNPWSIISLNVLAESFISKLICALGKEKEIQNELADFLGIILRFKYSALDVHEIKSKLFPAANLSSKDLVEFDTKRHHINQLLQDSCKPIFIFIDDIDRLNPTEIRMLFQLIKATCNFSNLKYLVAYDPIPVQKALSYDDSYDGRKFLEKIVQQSYTLPHLNYIQRKNYANSLFKKVLAINNESIRPYEEEIITSGINLIARNLETPRAILRVVHNFKLSLSIREDVNIGDILSFELLRFMFPFSVKAIAERQRLFCINHQPVDQDYSDIVSEHINIKNTPGEEYLKYLVKHNNLDENLSHSFSQIMGTIFPNIINVHCDVDEGIRSCRIYTSNALQALLLKASGEHTFSTQLIKTFLNVPNKRESILKEIELKYSVSIPVWISHLKSFVPDGGNQIDDLIHNLMQFSLKVFNNMNIDCSNETSSLAIHAIKHVNPPSDKPTILENIFMYKYDIAVQEGILLDMLENLGVFNRGKLYPDKIVEENYYNEFNITTSFATRLMKIWLAHAEELLNDECSLSNQPNFLSILFRIGQLGSFDKVHKFVERIVLPKENNMKRFIELFDNSAPQGIDALLGPNLDQFMFTIRDKAAYKSFISQLERHSIISKIK